MSGELLQQLALLYELQVADSGIDERRRTMEGLDDGSSTRAELAAAEQKLQAAQEKLRHDRATLRDKELQLASTEEEIETKRDQAYGGTISDPKQLSALERKIEELTVLKGKLEEQILVLMDQVEEEAAQVEELERQVALLRERAEDIEKHYEMDRSRLEGEIEQLQQRREELVGKIEPTLLRMYEQLRSRHRGVAVAAVEDGKCSACHTAVPRDIEAKLLHASVPVRCENCQRILWIVGLEAE